MGQEFFQREARDRQAVRQTGVGQRAREVGAGLQQVDYDEAEKERDERGAQEPAMVLAKMRSSRAPLPIWAMPRPGSRKPAER